MADFEVKSQARVGSDQIKAYLQTQHDLYKTRLENVQTALKILDSNPELEKLYDIVNQIKLGIF